MLLEPGIGLLFDRERLTAAQVRGKNGRQGFASDVTAGTGQNGPEISLIQILGHAAAYPIQCPQF